MKKILGIVVVVLIAIGGFMGYKYWDDTYNGKEAYAIVNEAPTKVESKNNDGSLYKKNGQQMYHYEYNFDFVTKDGKHIKSSWDSPESATPTALKTGSFVKAKVSAKRINEGPNVIEKDKVPSDILEKLQ